MKAASYARVSTDEQVRDGTSLDMQRERTRRYVEDQGWELVHQFADEGVSGAKDERERPALRALMRQVRAGEVEAIVVTKIDRFSRSIKNAINVWDELDVRGVAFISLSEMFDSSSPSGRLHRGILGQFAEFEREQIAERSSAGRRARAREGLWVGGRAPFGFTVEERRLAHHEEEVRTIRRAVALITSNRHTITQVAAILNREDRLPRQGNPRWHPRERRVEWTRDNLRYALTRETLIGKHVYGKASKVERIERDGAACPPILTRDEWDRVQAFLAATKRSVYRRPRLYPLSGRLVSPCGLRYSGQYDDKVDRRFYRCKGKEAPPYCSCTRLSAQELEDEVFAEVLDFFEDPERLLAATGLDEDDDAEAHREQLRAMDRKIANLSEAITGRAASALEEGISPTLMAAACGRLERERDELVARREEVAELEAHLRERAGRRARLSRLSQAAVDLVNSTDEQRKTLFSMLDVQARVTEKGLHIEGVFPENLELPVCVVDAHDDGGRRSHTTSG